jgi:hypothetical protein
LPARGAQLPTARAHGLHRDVQRSSSRIPEARRLGSDGLFSGPPPHLGGFAAGKTRWRIRSSKSATTWSRCAPTPSCGPPALARRNATPARSDKKSDQLLEAEGTDRSQEPQCYQSTRRPKVNHRGIRTFRPACSQGVRDPLCLSRNAGATEAAGESQSAGMGPRGVGMTKCFSIPRAGDMAPETGLAFGWSPRARRRTSRRPPLYIRILKEIAAQQIKAPYLRGKI